MKRFSPLLVAAMLALTLSGCIKPSDIKLRNVENVSVSIMGNVRITLSLDIENLSGFNVRVQDIKLTLHDNQSAELAEIVVNESIFLRRRSAQCVDIPVHVKLNDPIKALSLLGSLRNGSDDIFVSGQFVLKTCGIKKKEKIENIPLKRFAFQFDNAFDRTNI